MLNIIQLILLVIQVYSFIMMLTKYKDEITVYNFLAVGLSIPNLLIGMMR